jgi:hypothetical protein
VRYLRFAVTQLDCDSQVRQGLFHAVGELRDSDRLSTAELDRLDELRAWFRWRLAVPARFDRGWKVRASRGICWFKDGAVEHLGHARELAWLLREHGVVVHELWTVRPGYVVYQDRWQVVAEPFRDTGA